jgi:hypothetical protein
MKYLSVLIMAGLVVACSEAADPDGPSSSAAQSGSGASTSSNTSTTSTTGSAGATSSSTGGGGAPPGLEGLAINEIAADGADWIELFNTGAAPIDFTGIRIADDDGGMPKLDEAVDLTGAMLAPGEYLFVLADQAVPGMGEQTACDPYPPPCWHTGWGLSAPNGDVIYLVGAGDAVLMQEPYPANATVEPETWGRLPNGTGAFAINQATPKAENLAP